MITVHQTVLMGINHKMHKAGEELNTIVKKTQGDGKQRLKI